MSHVFDLTKLRQSGGNFMLFWLLVGMCTTEPLWRCGAFSTTEDHIIFSTHCQSVLDDGTKRVYSMFSCALDL